MISKIAIFNHTYLFIFFGKRLIITQLVDAFGNAYHVLRKVDDGLTHLQK